MQYVKVSVPDDFDPDLYKIFLETVGSESSCSARAELQIWEPVYRDVLDKGFIGLIDFMGDDQAVVDAARVSYGRGTRRVTQDPGLIRYLFRHSHWTPVEMMELKFHVKAPIVVFRQWHRHRTACLAGDVKLTFDLPGGVERRGNQAYTLTVKEIFERFQPSTRGERPERQTNAYFKQSRVKGMLLRSCDEDNLSLYHTQIVDIWENGVKPIIRVEFDNNKVLRATANHRCFTNMGWMRLEDALASGASFVSCGKEQGYPTFDPEFSKEELDNEIWRSLPSNDNYKVSSLGRVKSNKSGMIKDPTPTPQGYRVVSLTRDGISRTHLVHKLVLEAFGISRGENEQTRHLDNNRANNSLSNISNGTVVENTADRMESGNTQKLSITFTKATSYGFDGEEMTYDLEVSGPYHNFLAGGVFVHNSINEYSARYSILNDEMYMPDPSVMMPQSASNKQGREGKLSNRNIEACLLQLESIYSQCAQAYRYLLGMSNVPDDSLNHRFSLIREFAIEKIKHLQKTNPDWDPDKVTDQMVRDKETEILEANGLISTDEEFWGENGSGLSREVARMAMPLSTYSEMYWKCDLRNTFNFISLRSDPHAQEEIRAYSNTMLEMIQPIAPICVAAFIDYQKEGVKFSRMEVEVLKDLYKMSIDSHKHKEVEDMIEGRLTEMGCSKREIREFLKRMES